jgi:histone acetyltransferase (RNA polymerase elongator complex component)
MNKIIPIFVPHQGCPQRCVFCHQPHITGIALHTSVTPADVRQTIETALREPKSRRKGVRFEAAFYGGTFTGLPLHLQEQFLRTVQPYITRGDLVGTRLSTHPAMFSEPIFALLSEFAVTMVELGVQSWDDAVLTRARRGHTAADAEQTIRRLQRAGIAVGIHLMIGLPGDSAEISLASARRTIALRPAGVRLHPTLVLHDTQLERWYRRGRYTPLTLEAAVSTCAAMLKLFRASQIPVIRIGLQPTASLQHQLAAGPFHPALRQFVESAVLYEQMADVCETLNRADQPVCFRIAPQDMSNVRGQKNANLHKLEQQFGMSRVHFVPDAGMARGTVQPA